MDGKPPGGPGGAGRRPMLIKQENMMGSPDGYPGNMGVCLSGIIIFSTFSLPSISYQFRSFTTLFNFVETDLR